MCPDKAPFNPAGDCPAPAGSGAVSASGAESPAAPAGQGQGLDILHLAERVKAAAGKVVKEELSRPGSHPDWLVEMAVGIFLTPTPRLRSELRELAEKGRLSVLDPLLEVAGDG